MDLRVNRIFTDEMLNDNSFKESLPAWVSLVTGPIKYSQKEAREIWQRGIRHGIELGLRRASVEGQRIELNQNSKPEHKEVLTKLYAFLDENQISIEYHPEHGMMVLDKKPQI